MMAVLRLTGVLVRQENPLRLADLYKIQGKAPKLKLGWSQYTPTFLTSVNIPNHTARRSFMNLELEVLEGIETPISTQEGIGIVMISLGTGLLVGILIAT